MRPTHIDPPSAKSSAPGDIANMKERHFHKYFYIHIKQKTSGSCNKNRSVYVSVLHNAVNCVWVVSGCESQSVEVGGAGCCGAPPTTRALRGTWPDERVAEHAPEPPQLATERMKEGLSVIAFIFPLSSSSLSLSSSAPTTELAFLTTSFTQFACATQPSASTASTPHWSSQHWPHSRLVELSESWCTYLYCRCPPSVPQGWRSLSVCQRSTTSFLVSWS